MLYQGDIIEVNFDSTRGHEHSKERPAVVVSTDEFNMMSSLIFLAPITSVDNGYPLHVRINEGCEVSGCICVEQIRSVDLSARKYRKLGEASSKEMNRVLTLIGSVFGI